MHTLTCIYASVAQWLATLNHTLMERVPLPRTASPCPPPHAMGQMRGAICFVQAVAKRLRKCLGDRLKIGQWRPSSRGAA